MKVTVCVLVLVRTVAIVLGEECHQPGDCNHVTCPENDFTLDCHSNQCTCTHNQAQCTLANDCHHAGPCDRHWHCIDGRCRCGFGFGGGPPGGGPAPGGNSHS